MIYVFRQITTNEEILNLKKAQFREAYPPARTVCIKDCRNFLNKAALKVLIQNFLKR